MVFDDSLSAITCFDRAGVACFFTTPATPASWFLQAWNRDQRAVKRLSDRDREAGRSATVQVTTLHVILEQPISIRQLLVMGYTLYAHGMHSPCGSILVLWFHLLCCSCGKEEIGVCAGWLRTIMDRLLVLVAVCLLAGVGELACMQLFVWCYCPRAKCKGTIWRVDPGLCRADEETPAPTAEESLGKSHQGSATDDEVVARYEHRFASSSVSKFGFDKNFEFVECSWSLTFLFSVVAFVMGLLQGSRANQGTYESHLIFRHPL